MAGTYVLVKTSDGQFLFNLKAENGERILTSERYVAKAGALTGIESVRVNAAHDARYDRRISRDRKPYFVLKAANDEVIGTSEEYSSAPAMEIGIRSVKTNAPKATVDDRT